MTKANSILDETEPTPAIQEPVWSQVQQLAKHLQAWKRELVEREERIKVCETEWAEKVKLEKLGERVKAESPRPALPRPAQPEAETEPFNTQAARRLFPRLFARRGTGR